MASALSNGARIRTNTPAENAFNALTASSNNIALRQLRLSTGKRINSAADDVAGYITSRSLQARNGALKSALLSVSDAKNVTSMSQDALDNVNTLLTTIKDAAASSSSGSLGTDEKVALAKSAYRLSQQIQSIVDSTVFGGKQLINGTFSGSWTMGYVANNNLITIGIDLTTANADFNTSVYAQNGSYTSTNTFNLNAVASGGATYFAGVSGLNLNDLNSVSASDLGIFGTTQIVTTLQSLSYALNNVNKVASYLGGIENRLSAQENLLNSQITNYNAAISNIEDADVATEQLGLIKSQFLQKTSIISLTQANQTPQTYLSLFQ